MYKVMISFDVDRGAVRESFLDEALTQSCEECRKFKKLCASCALDAITVILELRGFLVTRRHNYLDFEVRSERGGGAHGTIFIDELLNFKDTNFDELKINLGTCPTYVPGDLSSKEEADRA